MRKGKTITHTSIDDDVAQAWLKKAKERETLACTRLPGFHLVRLKKGGAWRWRYTDALGNRKVATVGKSASMTAEQAADIVADWIKNEVDPLRDKATRQDQKRTAIEESERRTLRYYLENHYQRVMASWSYQSARANNQRMYKHFDAWLDRDITAIKKPDVRAWQASIEKQGKAYSTIKRTYSALVTMLNSAVDDGVIDVNPLSGVKLLPPTQAAQAAVDNPDRANQRRMLTHAELEALHRGLALFDEDIRTMRANSRAHGKNLSDLSQRKYPHWFHPFALLALHTGLRTGDLITLKWSELNVEFGRLVKVPEKTRHKAVRAGKKPIVVEMKLNDTIIGIMRTWKREQGGDVDLVFPSPRTGRQLTKGAHTKPWEAVKRLGGLPDDLLFYSLRHHFISAIIDQTQDYDLARELAGHKSIAMIESHYRHASENRKNTAIDVTAGRFDPEKINRKVE